MARSDVLTRLKALVMTDQYTEIIPEFVHHFHEDPSWEQDQVRVSVGDIPEIDQLLHGRGKPSTRCLRAHLQAMTSKKSRGEGSN